MTTSDDTPQELAAEGPDRDEISFMDLALVLAEQWRLLVVLPLAAGLIALGISFLIAPTYTASTRLLTPQQTTSTAAAMLGAIGGAAAGSLGNLAGLKNPADKWVGLLNSRVVADALVDRFDLQRLYDKEFRFLARQELAKNTRISAGKDGLILLEVDDHSPERAAQIVGAYVEELQKLTNTLAVSEAAQRRVFFEKQLTEARDNLTKAEIALKQGGIDAAVLKTSPEATVEQVARAQAAVAAQEVRVQVMRGSMTDGSPAVKQALLELESLRQQLRKVEQEQPGTALDASAQYVSRYRNFKYYETLFELFARQYELARADEARDGALVQVVDPVQVPEYKSRPKRAVIAVTTTAATLGTLLAFLFGERSLQRYRSSDTGRTKLRALRTALFGRR